MFRNAPTENAIAHNFLNFRKGAHLSRKRVNSSPVHSTQDSAMTLSKGDRPCEIRDCTSTHAET